MSTCRSCGKAAGSLTRWSPVIIKGQVVGHTCPSCPKHGEPVERMVNGKGVRYRVRLDAGVGERKQVSKSFDSLADAREYVETRSRELKRLRQQGISSLSAMTVNDLCDDFLAFKRGRVSDVTSENYEHHLKPVRRHLGTKRVDRLDYRQMEQLAVWLVKQGGRKGKPLNRVTARSCLTTFQQALDRAVRVHKLIPVNVARGVALPLVENHDEGVLERWTVSELNQFTKHADDDDLAIGWRMLSLGMRREEVLGMSWDAVDFEAGTITIQRSRVRVSKGTDSRGWVVGPPKSKASRRTIRPDDVQPGTMTLFKTRWLAAGRPSTGFVVLDAYGEPVEPGWFSDRFGAVQRAAGVSVIRAHSCRHTVAYLLHDAGVPAVRAAAYLGHELRVHLSTYLFAREGDIDTAAVALGRVLAAARSGS